MSDTCTVSASSDPSHRILLVDDDAHVRGVVASVLKMEGMDVTTAADGCEALHILRNEPPPCLILLDLNMAGMDGWEFRRRQLLWREMADIPVVVLSGHAQVKAVTRAMSARAVLAKPVAFHHLLRVVDEHCAAGALRSRR
jgi:CheY-like chemotaxis protein